MANRSFYPLKGSLTQGVVLLCGKWTFNADESGAVDDVRSYGLTVGSLDADGTQLLTLNDRYAALLSVQCNVTKDFADGVSATTFPVSEPSLVELNSQAVATSAKTIDLQYVKLEEGAQQTRANLAGQTVYCRILLKLSSVGGA